jgi:hypothetical protein
MPKVIYERMFDYPLLYTTMCLQLVDQSLCYAKGILEDISVWVGNSYVPIDFMVVEAGGDDEKSPIILGWPFLNTAGAIIYANSAKICFNIKGKRKVSVSRIEYYNSPHIHNTPMSWRRRIIGGTRTRIRTRSHSRRQWGWSLQSTRSATISSSPRIWSRGMIQTSQPSNARSIEAPLRKLSATPDQEST